MLIDNSFAHTLFAYFQESKRLKDPKELYITYITQDEKGKEK